MCSRPVSALSCAVQQGDANSWNDIQKISTASTDCVWMVLTVLRVVCYRADKALQDIVYKVVPGLYKTEMKARRQHYNNNPEVKPANSEDGGEVADSLFFSPEDDISMSIEYFDNFK